MGGIKMRGYMLVTLLSLVVTVVVAVLVSNAIGTLYDGLQSVP